MPKFNMYQSLHTTVIGPEGLPLEIQIRTREMHDMAEFGVAAHWIYKQGEPDERRRRAQDGDAKLKWLRSMLDWQQELSGPQGVHGDPEGRPLRGGGLRLHAQGRGQVARRRRDAAGLRLRGPHRVGHRCVGAKVNGKIVPLHYELQVRRHRRGADLQARARPVARLARASSRRRARATRSSSGSRPSRARTPSTPAASCCRSTSRSRACPRRRSPARRCSPTSSARWASARPTTSTSRSAARRSRRRSSSTRSCSASSRARPPRPSTTAADDLVAARRAAPPADAARRSPYGIRVEGVDDVMLRLAKCCRPVPGDPIVGYISLGPRDHDPPRRLPERRPRCARTPTASSRVALGGRPRDGLQGRAAGRRLGPPPPARGPLADVRRGRHQHRRGALHRQPADGQEPLRRRGRPTRRRSRRPISRLRNIDASSTPTASRPAPAEPPATRLTSAARRCAPDGRSPRRRRRRSARPRSGAPLVRAGRRPRPGARRSARRGWTLHARPPRRDARHAT